LARERLKRFVTELNYEVTGEAKNAAEALALIKSKDPSVVLLDIEMPGKTGLQLAEKIGQLDYPPAVIFTTAYDQYALDAFSSFAVAYLLKPINRQKLQQALDKAQTMNKAQLAGLNIGAESSGVGQNGDDSAEKQTGSVAAPAKHITANSHRGVELIAIESIRYFLADSKYITVGGTEGESLIDGTLRQLETKFAETFVRIHRNALVSIPHILGLDRAAEGHYTVRLQGTDIQLVVSRRYASKVKALLMSL
jgi:two-component system response regulator AlgR